MLKSRKSQNQNGLIFWFKYQKACMDTTMNMDFHILSNTSTVKQSPQAFKKSLQKLSLCLLSLQVCVCITLFFIRTSTFRSRLGCSQLWSIICPRRKSLVRNLWKSLWEIRNLVRLGKKSLEKWEISSVKSISDLPLGFWQIRTRLQIKCFSCSLG